MSTDAEKIAAGRAAFDHWLETVRAEARAEVLREVAVDITALRSRNPVNGDGANYMLERVINRLDVIAGNHAPSWAAEYEWARRMDEYEARYYGGDGQQHVRRLEAMRRGATP